MQAEALFTSKGSILKGPLLLKPNIFEDSRGYFFESWNEQLWKTILVKNGQEPNSFLQDNQSCSFRGILRGLHYQLNPHPQGKLVRCVAGEIYDVAVDLRSSSVTFGQWVGARLSADNKNQLWVPVGFAHGFLTLSEHAQVLYKTTDFWSKKSERAIRWDDSHLAIEWPIVHSNKKVLEPILSEKDALAPCLNQVPQVDLFE